MITYDIAVIGAGAAGQMGALRAVLNNKNTIVFRGDARVNKKSRATWVSKVVNMPFTVDIPRPITKATNDTFHYLSSHSYFATKFTQIKDAVTSIRKENGIFHLISGNNSYQAKFVLLATGVMDVQPLINGSIQEVLPYANSGYIDYCIRCDGHNSIGKITATIGHTETAVAVAVILHERYLPPEMKIFTNGEQPVFSDNMMALVAKYGIKIVTQSITGIKGDAKTKMEAFILADGTEEPVEMAFPLLGQIAYNELALEIGAEVNAKGNVVCDAKGQSSVEGFYVAGDLRDTGKYQIYTAWDQAVDSVDDMDYKLRMEYRASV